MTSDLRQIALLRHEHGAMPIADLRDIFGSDFAPGAAAVTPLSAYLDTLDTAALAGFLNAWNTSDEAPPPTSAMLEDAELFRGSTFLRRGRGRPPTGNAKEQVSLRLDREVLATLREAGPGWQSQVNGLLRAGLGLDQPHAAPVMALQRQVEGGRFISATPAAPMMAEAPKRQDRGGPTSKGTAGATAKRAK